MDSQQQNNEPKREEGPDDRAKVITSAKKGSILSAWKCFLGVYIFSILIEGSPVLLLYPELYDLKTHSAQLMSNKLFWSDLVFTMLGLLQLPFVVMMFQALRRKSLDKYLIAKKLYCIPGALEFFKTINRVFQDISLNGDNEDVWTFDCLFYDCVPMLMFALFLWIDKKIRQALEDEKRESTNNIFEKSENVPKEKETSVHLDKLNSSSYVVYKYWVLISGLWTIQWLYLAVAEGIQSLPEKIDSAEIIMGLTGLGVIAFMVWHIVNCFLIFEAMRRRNLKKVQSSIKSMEIYSIAVIIIFFFGFGNETFRNFMKREDPEMFDVNPMTWSFIVAACLLVWRIYYHFIYMYGAYKFRDVLKTHEKSKHSQ